MTIFLHVGTHKTGSKSLQALLADHAGTLARAGYDLYTGCHRNPRNHTELHLASQRVDRDSLAKHNWPDLVLDDDYVTAVRDRVQRFLRGSSAPHQVFSNEDIAFLRHPDEFERLAALFGDRGACVQTVLVRRQREDFLRAYKQQILKKPGRVPLSDPQSALYVGEDSWLCDLGPLIDGLSATFRRPTAVIEYEKALVREGSTVPAVLRAIGVEPDQFPWQDYFLHRSEAHEYEQPNQGR